MTFWPFVIIFALSSLKMAFNTNFGTGNIAGRFKACAKACKTNKILVIYIIILKKCLL